MTFEGEQHGFRKAENIVRALEAELYFYGKVFGFTPAPTRLGPVTIGDLYSRAWDRGRGALQSMAAGA